MSDSTRLLLRFRSDQYVKITALAIWHDVSVAEYMREAILAQVADQTDYQAAIANIKASKGATVSRDKIMKETGLS